MQRDEEVFGEWSFKVVSPCEDHSRAVLMIWWEAVLSRIAHAKTPRQGGPVFAFQLRPALLGRSARKNK